MEKYEIEWMNYFIKRLEDDGIDTSCYNKLTDDEKMKRLKSIAPLYGIDLKLAKKINRKLARLKWEEENDDLIGTDKDPHYVEDMKSGKYKNKKDYYWKNYRVIIDEADEAAENK